MKCSACLIELTDNPKEHYLTDWHSENIRRKINNIPPITNIEEFESTNIINTQESNKLHKEKKRTNKKIGVYVNDNQKQVIGEFECFLCDQNYLNKNSLLTHLESHKINVQFYEQFKYLLNEGKCIFCCQIIEHKSSLKNHILKVHSKNLFSKEKSGDGNATSIQVDGAYGYLENGKILGSKEYLNVFKQVHRPLVPKNDKVNGQIELHKISRRETNIIRKERKRINRYSLKVSLGMNHQLHFTEHWMQ